MGLLSLLDYEADVNAQDVFGNTPLMYAASIANGLVVRQSMNTNQTVL